MSYRWVRWPHTAGLIPCHGGYPPAPHKPSEFVEGWQRAASDKREGNTESCRREYEPCWLAVVCVHMCELCDCAVIKSRKPLFCCIVHGA